MAGIVNPGLAFSQGFEDYLLQRDALARQKRLDDLAFRREDRMARADELDMQVRQDEIRRKQADDFVKNYKATHIKGDIPDAETVKRAKDLGVEYIFNQDPEKVTLPSQQMGGAIRIGEHAPQVDSLNDAYADASPSAPIPGSGGTMRFRGTDKELQQEERRKAAQSLLDSLDDSDPAAKAYRRELEFWIATGEQVPASMAGIVGGTAGKPTRKKVYAFNPLNGKMQLVDEVDANSQVERMGATPDTATPSFLTPEGNFDIDKAAQFAGLTRKGLLTEAVRVAESGMQPPIGRTKEGKALYTAIVNTVPELERNAQGKWTFQGQAIDVPSLAQAKSDFGADSSSQRSLQTNLDAATAFSRVADDNSKILEETLKKIPDTGIQFFNRPIRGLATAFGNDAMSQFAAIRQSVQNEYSRLTSQPNLTGVLTDSARHEMESILDPNATVEQIRKSLAILQREGHNRVNDYQKQVNEIRGRISGSAEPRGGTSSTEPKPDPKSIMDDIIKGMTPGGR